MGSKRTRAPSAARTHRCRCSSGRLRTSWEHRSHPGSRPCPRCRTRCRSTPSFCKTRFGRIDRPTGSMRLRSMRRQRRRTLLGKHLRRTRLRCTHRRRKRRRAGRARTAPRPLLRESHGVACRRRRRRRSHPRGRSTRAARSPDPRARLNSASPWVGAITRVARHLPVLEARDWSSSESRCCVAGAPRANVARQGAMASVAVAAAAAAAPAAAGAGRATLTSHVANGTLMTYGLSMPRLLASAKVATRKLCENPPRPSTACIDGAGVGACDASCRRASNRPSSGNSVGSRIMPAPAVGRIAYSSPATGVFHVTQATQSRLAPARRIHARAVREEPSPQKLPGFASNV